MSRVIVKNLPKYIKKSRIEQLFSVYGTITDVRMIYTNGDLFRRIAFVGFSNDDEAMNAVSKMNNTYIDTCKIAVEVAKTVNDETLDRPWSRYSKQSSAYKKGEKEKVERLKIINQFKNKCSTHEGSNFSEDRPAEKPLSKHESMIMDVCGISSEDQEKFNEYMMLNNAKTIDFSCTTKSNESLSAHSAPEDNKDSYSNNEIVYTAKLSNLRPNIKLIRLLKFFKGLDVMDIRIIPPGARKKTCVAFVDFSNESDLQRAIKMSGKSLKGNSVRILEYDNSKLVSKMHFEKPSNTEDDSMETLLDTGRIFVANLPYVCDYDDVKQLFEKYGPIVDLNMPIDKNTSKPTGYALITYMLPENCVTAYNNLNSYIFKGRLLRLIPAKSSDNIDDFSDFNGNSSSYKLKKLKKMKQCASDMVHTWNTLFINQNTVANILSKRLGISKDKLLMDTSQRNNPAVSIAAGETALVNETKNFLESNGVNLDSFGKVDTPKSDCVLLAKNLPEDVTSAQILEFISEKLSHNSKDDENYIIKPRIIVPPYGVTAIIKFDNPQIAKLAFKKLAFTRFRFTPLYLEWAPKDTLISNSSNSITEVTDIEDKPNNSNKTSIPISGCVVFIKNLSSNTTEEAIKNHVSKVAEPVNVTLACSRTSTNDKRSLGYGFIEFSNPDDAKECVKLLQGTDIDDNKIELKLSDRKIIPKISLPTNNSVNDLKPSDNKTEDGEIPKILVRNIPFEATKNDVFQLFKTYGNVKCVRLPKKLATTSVGSATNQHRGFAFIEFMTLEDAKYCFECMRYSTHLYGRRLVLEWANDNTSLPSIRKRTAQHFTNDNSGYDKTVSDRITQTLDNV